MAPLPLMGPAYCADLVVDATGVSSEARRDWLTAIGVQPAHETVVDAFVGYAGIWMRMREGVEWPKDWWWTAGAMIYPVPFVDTKTIILSKHEHDRWLLLSAAKATTIRRRISKGFARSR